MKKKAVRLNGVNKSKAKLNVKKKNKTLEFFRRLFHLTADDMEKRAVKRRMKRFKKLRQMRINEKLKKEQQKNTFVRSKKRIEKELSRQQLIHKAYKDLLIHFKNELNVAAFSLYIYSQSGYCDIEYLMGDKLDHVIYEHYLSYSGTTILVNPEGLTDGEVYKSRMITQLYIDDVRYVIILSSFAMEAFKGKNALYIINALRHMKRKTGEANEYSDVLREEIQKAV